MAYIIFSVGTLVFLAHLFTLMFQKTKVPDVLPLMAIGLVVGPVLGLVSPASFGKVGSVFSVIALIIILFHSGVELPLVTLRNSMAAGTRLATFGFFLTTGVVAAAGFFVLGFSFLESLLLGSVLGGTSSAVVIPMAGRLGISENAKTALTLDSTFTDVFCIIFSLAFLKAIQYHDLDPGQMAGQVIASFFMATLLGTVAAVLWSAALGRVRGLENNAFTTPAFVFVVYGLVEMLGFSGAIAAFACGVTLGNVKSLPERLIRRLGIAEPLKLNETERTILGEAVFLLKSFFFVYIGLSISFGRLELVLTSILLAFLVLVARLPVVRVSMGKEFSRYDASVAFAMMPKGLAPAVLASLFLEAGIPKAGEIQDIVYSLILISILLAAIMVFLGERKALDRVYAAIFPGYPPPEGEHPAPGAGNVSRRNIP